MERLRELTAIALAVALSFVAAMCDAAGATTAKKSGKNINDGFEKVPKRALVELKAAIGKPIDTGIVFVNGKYIAPPYKVERYGTALRINGMQISGQVVPWDEFVKTQAGAKIEKTMVGGDPADADEPEEEPEAEEPEEEEEEDEENWDDDEDFDDDIDDLFDDVVAPKKTVKAGGKATLATSKKVKAKKRVPVEVVKVTLEGEFKPNEKSNALLAKVNKARTDIDALLRGGGYACFGARYTAVTGDNRPAGTIMKALPKVMKANNDYADFAAAAKASGMGYLPDGVLRDLFANRIDYRRLEERIRADKEAAEMEKLIGGGR